MTIRWIRGAASSSITNAGDRVVETADSSPAEAGFGMTKVKGLAQFSIAHLLQSQLFCQLLPLAVDQGFGLGVHQDFIRPGTREAFARPLAGSVNAHLRAVIWQAGSVVERINRPQRELDVALGIDVVEHFQREIGYGLDVDVFINDDDAL